MANVTNKQFRLMLDHSEVLKNSIANVVVTDLRSKGASDTEAKDLISKINREVTVIFDGMIDRLQK